MEKLRMVLGFLFTEDLSHVLLIRKVSPPWQYGFFNGLGGKEEIRGFPADEMAREFEEECGMVIPSEQWQQRLIMQNEKAVITVFMAKADEVRIALEARSTGAEKVKLYSVFDVLTGGPVILNLRWIIPMLLDQGTVGAVVDVTVRD